MSEFKFYLERPELIEKYNNVILEIQKSNYKYPHRDKFDTIKRYSKSEYWLTGFLVEMVYLYNKFYDRNLVDILKMTNEEILMDLQNKYIQFCTDYPVVTSRGVNLTSYYYLKPFVNLSNDYNLNLYLDSEVYDLIIPKNFLKVINNVRIVYNGVSSKVRDKLGEIEYFTDDVIEIVLCYTF